MEAHVAYVKTRFNAPVYVSEAGDILVDLDGSPVVATAREVSMNDGDHMRALWSIRFAHRRGKTGDFMARGDWKLAA